MTDEHQLGGTTVLEIDGSGNLVIKNIDEATITALAGALDAGNNNITNIATVGASSADIGTLASALDANSNDITNIAQLSATNSDLGTLSAALNAGGFDITNIGTAITSTVETDTVDNQDYNEAVNTIANASGTTDIDLSVSNWHEVEADGDITITFSNVTSTPPGNSLLLYFEDDDSTGPHTITWPASVVWSDGTVRDTIEADSDLEISLRTPDGGTTWRATRSGRRFS